MMNGLVHGRSSSTQAHPMIDGTISLSSHPLSEKPYAEFMFGSGIEMCIPSFFDAVRCADDRQIKFRVSAYLGGALAYHGKWRGGESADKDGDHFERERDRRRGRHFGYLRGWALPYFGSVPSKEVGRKRVNCDGLFGKGMEKGVGVHGAGERC